MFMYQNKFLLPHFVQYIGGALSVLADVCMCFYRCEIVFILGVIGLLLMPISRERIEDEYIGYLRMRSIFYVVLVYMVYAVASPIVGFFCLRFMAFGTFIEVRNILLVLGSMPFLALLYFLLFKGAIMLGSKRKVAE